MYTPKCFECGGGGMTAFRQNGGRCYARGGSGWRTPADLARENARRAEVTVYLADGRRLHWRRDAVVLADAGDNLVWVDLRWALMSGVAVLAAAEDGWSWTVTRVTGVEGLGELVAPF